MSVEVRVSVVIKNYEHVLTLEEAKELYRQLKMLTTAEKESWAAPPLWDIGSPDKDPYYKGPTTCLFSEG